MTYQLGQKIYENQNRVIIDYQKSNEDFTTIKKSNYSTAVAHPSSEAVLYVIFADASIVDAEFY